MTRGLSLDLISMTGGSKFWNSSFLPFGRERRQESTETNGWSQLPKDHAILLSFWNRMPVFGQEVVRRPTAESLLLDEIFACLLKRFFVGFKTNPMLGCSFLSRVYFLDIPTLERT